MGQVTTNLQVWTPDTADLNKPDVYLATMSASIENGVGERMNKLEVYKGFLGHLPLGTNTTLNGTESQPFPFQVIATSGSFNDGFTLSNGVLTVGTAGLYFISSSATCTANTGEFNTYIYVNTTKMWRGYSKSSPTQFGYNTGSVVVKLAVGDTICVKSVVFASAGDVKISNGQYVDNSLSVALIKAV